MAEEKTERIRNISIGESIQACRIKKGLSQEELAEMVEATHTHISYIETGTKNPSLNLLIKIANALDVSADDLLVGQLKHTSSPVGKEMQIIMQGCNRDEEKMLTRIAKFMKELFIEFNI